MPATANPAPPQIAAPAANRTTTTVNAANPTPPAIGAVAPQPAQNDAQPAKKSDGSEFVVPANATAEQLVAQANALFSSNVSFETEEEYAAWVSKMLTTVGQISDRILKLNPDDAAFLEAIKFKGQVLCYQASLDPKVLPKLKAYADALEKHSRVQSLDEGKEAALAFKGVYLQAKVAEIAENEGTAKELVAAMAEVAEFVKAHPETADMTADLVYPVAVVAANVNDPKLPAQIWTPIRKILAASTDERAKAALIMLEGSIRYSELPGKTFEWKGCDVNGKPLDVSKVDGRVVLVEYWASWCQPSPLLHQQLAALYKTYHEGGFEIVSYNLDSKIEDMNAYLAKNDVYGLVLSDRATVDAKETSLAAYYGISEIPTMILVGGDGKVAAVDISIESLAATLANVFKKPAPELPGVQTEQAASGATSATNAAATTTTNAGAAGASARPTSGAAAPGGPTRANPATRQGQTSGAATPGRPATVNATSSGVVNSGARAATRRP